MMNFGIPDGAFIQSQIPNDGVGLAREEFIINSYIGIHPMALIEYAELKKAARTDEKLAEVIEKIDNAISKATNDKGFLVTYFFHEVTKYRDLDHSDEQSSNQYVPLRQLHSLIQN